VYSANPVAQCYLFISLLNRLTALLRRVTATERIVWENNRRAK
jgi:hypothetical protein